MKLRKWAKEDKPVVVRLDDDKMTKEATELEVSLKKKVIGQDRAIKQFVRAFETFQTGMQDPDKPLANLLFLGPTGVGKTRLVEAFCESLWGSSSMLLKVDCSEYQHSHETAKLIGSPPGYVGYNSGVARISQEILEDHWRGGKGPKMSVMLFDEIEKAHPDFFQLILGALDKGIITLGNNTKVILKRCIIVMTSNLGAKDVKKHLNEQHIGFTGGKTFDALDKRIYETAIKEVEKFFSPEFVNRLDRTVVFRALSEESNRAILNILLGGIQDRILLTGRFSLLDVTEHGKDFLLKEGISTKFGARELRRVIERFLVSRLTRLMATNQFQTGDMVLANYDDELKKFTFDLRAGVVDIPESATNPTKDETIRNQPNLVPAKGGPPDGTAREKITPPPPNRYWSTFSGWVCTKCKKSWDADHVCAPPDSDTPKNVFEGHVFRATPYPGCMCIFCAMMRAGK